MESGVWCAYLGCAGCGGGGGGGGGGEEGLKAERLKAERLAGRMRQREAREMVGETQRRRSSPHKERRAGTTDGALPDANRKFCSIGLMDDS